jgi:hypothetical protein
MEVSDATGTITIHINERSSKVYDLMCKCGHPASYHGMLAHFHYPDPLHHTFHMSQCTHCGSSNDEFQCPRFRKA